MTKAKPKRKANGKPPKPGDFVLIRPGEPGFDEAAMPDPVALSEGKTAELLASVSRSDTLAEVAEWLDQELIVLGVTRIGWQEAVDSAYRRLAAIGETTMPDRPAAHDSDSLWRVLIDLQTWARRRLNNRYVGPNSAPERGPAAPRHFHWDRHKAKLSPLLFSFVNFLWHQSDYAAEMDEVIGKVWNAGATDGQVHIAIGRFNESMKNNSIPVRAHSQNRRVALHITETHTETHTENGRSGK